MEMGGSSGSSESQLLKIGLQFGKEIYFEDVGVGAQVKSEDGSSPASGGADAGGPQKKGRTGGGGGGVPAGLGMGQQPPRCQVEGCNLDLSDAKTYYSRHKVCGAHSKTAKVIVNGLEQRFCQQCSRFHQLPEFDQGKRSCRRRLAGHNERRRKPSLISSRYGSVATSIFENNGNSGGGFLMDFSSCSRGRFQWPGTRAGPPRAAMDLPIAGEKFPPLPWQSNLDNPPPYNVPPGGCFNGVQDSNCALSLLSNHSSGSRNQSMSHEYYVNPEAGAHVHQLQQPATGTTVQVHYSTTTTGWVYETNDAHLGLGQIPQSGYSGDVGQQGGRRYDSSVDHIDWSL
ncbi:hypothetical protein L1887_22612 [Cichorium endivia]|nr:hypothetical protein L1887_22612 [Cichorium endivia]